MLQMKMKNELMVGKRNDYNSLWSTGRMKGDVCELFTFPC